MAVLKFITKSDEVLKKFNPDKIKKRIISGKDKSPFKNVDELGSFPVARNPRDLPGTEIKKLKEAGKKISKEFRKQDLKQKRELRNKTSKNMGGRIGYKSGMGVCKLAKRGKGRAYGKNS